MISLTFWKTWVSCSAQTQHVQKLNEPPLPSEEILLPLISVGSNTFTRARILFPLPYIKSVTKSYCFYFHSLNPALALYHLKDKGQAPLRPLLIMPLSTKMFSTMPRCRFYSPPAPPSPQIPSVFSKGLVRKYLRLYTLLVYVFLFVWFFFKKQPFKNVKLFLIHELYKNRLNSASKL